MLYVCLKICTKDKLEKITVVNLTSRKWSKAALAGDLNLDFNVQEGEIFVKALRVEDLELRTNPKHYIARARSTIDDIFSNETVKTCVYRST